MDNYFHVSDKELFYAAMMLKLDRLVGVEYVFPADEKRLAGELEEVKKALRAKKLLKENSKGEITLSYALSACAAFCARPDECMVVEEDGYSATAYRSADAYMLLERADGGGNMAIWFRGKEKLDDFITRKLGKGGSEPGKEA